MKSISLLIPLIILFLTIVGCSSVTVQTPPQIIDYKNEESMGCVEEYDLRLMSVKTTDELEGEGRSLVIVALVGDVSNKDLHIRIFDMCGEKVFDRAEKQLESGVALTALKQQLTALKSQENEQNIIDGSSLSLEEKQEIIRNATSSAGHTPVENTLETGEGSERLRSSSTPIKSSVEKSPALRPFYDRYWVLLEDMHYKLTRGTGADKKCFIIKVPAGFVTDLASIPPILTPIYDKYGRYSTPGIVHDFLYWTQVCNERNTADRIIKEVSKGIGMGYRARNSIKKAVQWFGKSPWKKNNKDRTNGYRRYIPVEMREFSPSMRWSDYKEKFMNTATPWDDLLEKEYDLRLMSVKTTDELEGEGRSLVIVALVGDVSNKDLHIRIFDVCGEKVFDRAEKQLESGVALTALKQQLTALKSQENEQNIIDGSSLSLEEKQEIIRNATSSTGHTLVKKPDYCCVFVK